MLEWEKRVLIREEQVRPWFGTNTISDSETPLVIVIVSDAIVSFSEKFHSDSDSEWEVFSEF